MMHDGVCGPCCGSAVHLCMPSQPWPNCRRSLRPCLQPPVYLTCGGCRARRGLGQHPWQGWWLLFYQQYLYVVTCILAQLLSQPTPWCASSMSVTDVVGADPGRSEEAFLPKLVAGASVLLALPVKCSQPWQNCLGSLLCGPHPPCPS